MSQVWLLPCHLPAHETSNGWKKQIFIVCVQTSKYQKLTKHMFQQHGEDLTRKFSWTPWWKTTTHKTGFYSVKNQHFSFLLQTGVEWDESTWHHVWCQPPTTCRLGEKHFTKSRFPYDFSQIDKIVLKLLNSISCNGLWKKFNLCRLLKQNQFSLKNLLWVPHTPWYTIKHIADAWFKTIEWLRESEV